MRKLPIVVLLLILGLTLPAVARAQDAPPAAPRDLSAHQHGVDLLLFWHDNADNEDAYEIERSSAGEDGPWEVVGTIDSVESCGRLPVETQCGYVDRLLVPDTTYWYRVAAVNEAGLSAYSNVASAQTVPRATPAPGQIRGFVFHDRNGDGVRGAGEEGLSRRQIELFQGEELLQTATSGFSGGGFFFHGLSPGQYTVVAADLAERWSSGCSIPDFSFNPLQLGLCEAPVFPWNPTSARSVDVTVDDGVTLDFGARPADVAVWAGHAILEVDYAPVGTEIVAFIDGQECGSATVTGESTSEFVLRVLGAGEQAGCPRPGDFVQVTVGGVPAARPIAWGPFSPTARGALDRIDLVAMEHHAWYWFQTSLGFLGEEPPAAGTLVQAVIDGVVCGEATIERSPDGSLVGFSRLIVPSAELDAGCGGDEAMVSFLFNGVATGEPIEWRPGLRFINPLVGPVLIPGSGGRTELPGTGTGVASSSGLPGAAIMALALAGALALVAGALARSRR